MFSSEPHEVLEHNAVNVRDVRDLSDFCQNWPDIRELVDIKELRTTGTKESQIIVIGWLMHLADKVCSTDSPIEELD